MLTTSDLLSAAKRGAGIPSNYRLARVLGTTDNTVFRWHSGAGSPDDAWAAKLAALAGMDVGYAVASMKAAREKDPELRAIWADMAERLLLTSGMPKKHDDSGPSSEGDDDESSADDDGGNEGENSLLSSIPITHIMRSTTVEQTPEIRRLRRLRPVGPQISCI